MNRRIASVSLALLLSTVCTLWASPHTMTISKDCATQALLTSSEVPQSSQASRTGGQMTPADASSLSCCTSQDRADCYGNIPEGCWVEVFYCYQNQFCYCGYQCW